MVAAGKTMWESRHGQNLLMILHGMMGFVYHVRFRDQQFLHCEERVRILNWNQNSIQQFVEDT